ncbi:hypothetical protein L596_015378 [Steinernema carpocapsae]|uniref:Uncharacterized protein n=1 Tax=Steinernema carpocapsae TaxID=34508 RepID=A0A4U5NFT3_STECR|nr:hypothetical protein L596_015378 [Steinernema carpocapsae]
MSAEDLEAEKLIEKMRPRVRATIAGRLQRALEENPQNVKQTLMSTVDVKLLMLKMGVPMPSQEEARKIASRKKRNSDNYVRPRTYDVDNYTIGEFQMPQNGEGVAFRNKVKINFSLRNFQFCFLQELVQLVPVNEKNAPNEGLNRLQYADPQLNGLQYVEAVPRKTRQFTIEITFDSVTALCFDKKMVYMRVKQPLKTFNSPWDEKGQAHLPEDELSHVLDPTNGLLARTEVHAIELNRDYSLRWLKCLQAYEPAFERLIQNKATFMNHNHGSQSSFYCYAPLGNEVTALSRTATQARKSCSTGQERPVLINHCTPKVLAGQNVGMMYADPQLNQLQYVNPDMNHFERDGNPIQGLSEFFSTDLQQRHASPQRNSSTETGALQYADPDLNDLQYADPDLELFSEASSLGKDVDDIDMAYFQGSESQYATCIGPESSQSEYGFLRPTADGDFSDLMAMDDLGYGMSEYGYGF